MDVINQLIIVIIHHTQNDPLLLLSQILKNQIKYQVTILSFNQLLDTFDPLLFLIDNIQKVFLIFV